MQRNKKEKATRKEFIQKRRNRKGETQNKN